MKALKNISIYIALIIGVILLAVLVNGVTSAPEMSYNKFVTELIENDNVKKVSVDGNVALVELKENMAFWI